ncbi:MAG: imidazolonepropionase [Legionellaceae bacterium]|nr:imidazolonepropionase [Legionellaceae bacterium]
MTYDLIIKNATIATCDKQHTLLHNASLGIQDGLITQLTQEDLSNDTRNIIDACGKLLTPGLIDCHTHLVYGGNRADEFAMRLNGATYADIANQGGGILSTVSATRQASTEELTETATQRASIMLAHGTTTVEIKSGYGLDLETEIKLLKVAQSLESILPMTVVTTFLGAHTTPPEYKHDKEAYIDYIISTVMPCIAKEKLATFVDAFCEKIAFSPSQVERLFKAATQYGFLLKLHAEQLTDQKSALLAARFEATSVDHLECLAPEDCDKLRNGKTVAVLLPGAFYFLKETQKPPVDALRKHQIPIAIATDANPGSSPFLTLPLMMNMACVLFGLSIEEAWLAVTIHAAQALNLHHELGSITIGKKADLVLWSTDNINDIVYNPSINYCQQIIKSGKLVG